MPNNYRELIPGHLQTPRFLRYWAKYLNWAAQSQLWFDYSTIQRNIRFLSRGDAERAILILMVTMEEMAPRPKSVPPLSRPHDSDTAGESGPLYPFTVDGERWAVKRGVIEQYRRDGIPLAWSPTGRTFYIRPQSEWEVEDTEE